VNRLPPEERGHLEERLSSFLIKIPKTLDNPGTLNLGNCPIVVQDCESANKAADWAYDEVIRQLTEQGATIEDARKVAEQCKLKQLDEMLKGMNEV